LTIAVVSVPIEQEPIYVTQCLEYCALKGYEVVGVVVGDSAAAIAMLMNHTAGVLVIARPEHLDSEAARDVEPRIEFADPPNLPHTARRARRSRIIRRDAAG